MGGGKNVSKSASLCQEVPVQTTQQTPDPCDNDWSWHWVGSFQRLHPGTCMAEGAGQNSWTHSSLLWLQEQGAGLHLQGGGARGLETAGARGSPLCVRRCQDDGKGCAKHCDGGVQRARRDVRSGR